MPYFFASSPSASRAGLVRPADASVNPSRIATIVSNPNVTDRARPTTIEAQFPMASRDSCHPWFSLFVGLRVFAVKIFRGPCLEIGPALVAYSAL